MARKGLLGKLFTVAAAAAAISGACYIFRDKIKASKLYEELDVDDKLHSLKNMLKKEEDEEDFFEEDEYIFNTDEDDSNRTYVSLNPESATVIKPAEDADTEEPTEDTNIGEPAAKYTETKSEETKNESADEVVPTIALDTLSEAKGDAPSGYDMEGLSDVSEDPDVLMEQDLLDESPFEFY